MGLCLIPRDHTNYFLTTPPLFPDNTLNRKPILIPPLKVSAFSEETGETAQVLAIPLRLQVWMASTVCTAKIRHVGLSDE